MPKPPTIKPSVRFRVLSVHKMHSMSCLRQFFYERVLNLQTSKIIIPFWFGGILHTGIQYLLLGYNDSEIDEAMELESRRRCKGSVITATDKAEMALQFQILRTLVFTAREVSHTNWRLDKIDLDWSEEQVSWPVPGFPDVQFCSTIDGGGTVRGRPSLIEIKTAKSVSNDYFATLEFDAQVCSYILGHKKDRKNGTNKCLYMVFRKPQLRIKKTETIDEFADRIAQDLVDRPDFYFMSKSLTIGKNAIRYAQEDIIADTEILTDRYDKLNKRGGLLKAKNWPKKTKYCDYYNRPCPFKMVCRHGGDPSTFMPMFRQREMLYEAERKELAK